VAKIHLNIRIRSSDLVFLLPELLVPGFMLFAGDFPVFGGSIEALMPQVLLKKT
jgi:hypothetical protein